MKYDVDVKQRASFGSVRFAGRTITGLAFGYRPETRRESSDCRVERDCIVSQSLGITFEGEEREGEREKKEKEAYAMKP